MGSGAPHDDIGRVVDVHRRLEAAVSGLGDGDAGLPSRLPGWSVGHLLAHIARNADSVRRRAEGAARGEVVDQYPGGYEGRAAEIEAGAARTATELLDDIAGSNAALEKTLAALPDAAWDGLSRDVGGTERPVRDLPRRRWYEVEVHLADIGGSVALTYDDWPDEFVEQRLPEMRRFQDQSSVVLTPREELAWLYGRLMRHDLPEVQPWG